MRFRAWAGSVLVVMWSLGASSQVEASRLTMGHLEDAGSGIVWDGDSDVRTMNQNQSETFSGQIFDPNALGINVSLTSDLNNEVNIFLRLVITPDLRNDPDFDPPLSWQTLAEAMLGGIGSDLQESDFEPPSAGERRIVAMTLDFPQINAVGPVGILPAQRDALSTLLTSFSDLDFYVGILAVNNGSLSDNTFITFDVATGSPPAPPASVPEPSTALLLGVGAVGMIGRRFRKRA